MTTPVTLTMVGEPEVSAWCERCLSHALIRGVFIIDTTHETYPYVVEKCVGCGRESDD